MQSLVKIVQSLARKVQFLAKRELSLVFGYSHQLDVKLQGGVGLDDCALAGGAVSHVVGHAFAIVPT